MAYNVKSFNKLQFISLYRGFRIKPRLITPSAISFSDKKKIKVIALEDVAKLVKSRYFWTPSQIEASKNKLIGSHIYLNDSKCLHSIDEKTVNSVILGSCKKFGLVENGLNYFKSLVKTGETISFTEIRILLDLVGTKKDISEENRLFLYEQYQYLMKRLEVFDDMTLWSCIHFLTSHEAYINDAIKTVESKGSACNQNEFWIHIAGAAFEADQVNLGWESLNKITQKYHREVRMHDLEHAITGFINYCSRKVDNGTFSVEEFEKIFQYLSDQNVSVVKGGENTILQLMKFLNKLNHSHERDYTWKLSHVSVDRESGHCSACKNNLENIVLDQESFNELRITFLSEVVIGKNVFIKSSPEEIKKYYKFLRSSPHFDIIIDGLNMALLEEGHLTNANNRIDNMLRIIDYFQTRNKVVLLIGRKHMKKWPRFEEIEKACQTFLFDNASDDDALLVYGAMYKGWDTYMCTSDFLRGKTIFFTDPRMVKLFEIWHRSHQYGVLRGSWLVVPPFNHCLYTHKITNSNTLLSGESCWHIAYLLTTRTGLPFYKPFYWFCVQRRGRQTKGFENVQDIHDVPPEALEHYKYGPDEVRPEVKIVKRPKFNGVQDKINEKIVEKSDTSNSENSAEKGSAFEINEELDFEEELTSKKTQEKDDEEHSSVQEKVKTEPLSKIRQEDSIFGSSRGFVSNFRRSAQVVETDSPSSRLSDKNVDKQPTDMHFETSEKSQINRTNEKPASSARNRVSTLPWVRQKIANDPKSKNFAEEKKLQNQSNFTPPFRNFSQTENTFKYREKDETIDQNSESGSHPLEPFSKAHSDELQNPSIPTFKTDVTSSHADDVIAESNQKRMESKMAAAHLKEILYREKSEESSSLPRGKYVTPDEFVDNLQSSIVENAQDKIFEIKVSKSEAISLKHLKEILNRKTDEEPTKELKKTYAKVDERGATIAARNEFVESKPKAKNNLQYLKEVLNQKDLKFGNSIASSKKAAKSSEDTDSVGGSYPVGTNDSPSVMTESKEKSIKSGTVDIDVLRNILNFNSDAGLLKKSEDVNLKPVEDSSNSSTSYSLIDETPEKKQEALKVETADIKRLKEILGCESVDEGFSEKSKAGFLKPDEDNTSLGKINPCVPRKIQVTPSENSEFSTIENFSEKISENQKQKLETANKDYLIKILNRSTPIGKKTDISEKVEQSEISESSTNLCSKSSETSSGSDAIRELNEYCKHLLSFYCSSQDSKSFTSSFISRQTSECELDKLVALIEKRFPLSRRVELNQRLEMAKSFVLHNKQSKSPGKNTQQKQHYIGLLSSSATELLENLVVPVFTDTSRKPKETEDINAYDENDPYNKLVSSLSQNVSNIITKDKKTRMKMSDESHVNEIFNQVTSAISSKPSKELQIKPDVKINSFDDFLSSLSANDTSENKNEDRVKFAIDYLNEAYNNLTKAPEVEIAEEVQDFENTESDYDVNRALLYPWTIFKSSFKTSRIKERGPPYWVYQDYNIINEENQDNRFMTSHKYHQRKSYSRNENSSLKNKDHLLRNEGNVLKLVNFHDIINDSDFDEESLRNEESLTQTNNFKNSLDKNLSSHHKNFKTEKENLLQSSSFESSIDQVNENDASKQFIDFLKKNF